MTDFDYGQTGTWNFELELVSDESDAIIDVWLIDYNGNRHKINTIEPSANKGDVLSKSQDVIFDENFLDEIDYLTEDEILDMEVEVDTGYDKDSRSVKVFSGLRFTGLDSVSDVSAGTNMSITGNFENKQPQPAEFDVELLIDGQVVDSIQNASVFGGGSTSITLRWQTDSSDVGSHNATMRHDGTTYSDSFNVLVSNDSIWTTNASGDVTEYSIDSNDLGTLSQVVSNNLSDVERGGAWNKDGTKFFSSNTFPGEFLEYNVSTPYDISTASLSNANESDTPGTIHSLSFNSDGSKVFLGDHSGGVWEMTLGSSFDSSSMTKVDEVSYGSRIGGIAFNTDGTKMFLVDYSNKDITEYNLGTAFDISTSTQVTTINSQLQVSGDNPSGIVFSKGGDYMFICGKSTNNSNTIYRYSLSTPFDISTATNDQSGDVGSVYGLALKAPPHY